MNFHLAYIPNVMSKPSKRKHNLFKRLRRKLAKSQFLQVNYIDIMTRRFLLLACLFGAFAVIMGAFGAHILKQVLTESDMKVYKTGVEYQFYHTFALLMAAILSRYASKKWTKIASWLFVVGIIFFSGSLYFLSLATAFEMEALKPIFGPITPIGGILLIGGWLSLFFAALKYKDRSHSHSRSHSSQKASKALEEA